MKKEWCLVIVEDDEAVLHMAARELKKEVDFVINDPVNVEDVNTIENAYNFIISEETDIVILDFFLKGGENTLELVKKCHTSGIKPLFIVHSNEWRHEGTRAKFAALGVTQGVNKIEFKEMKEIIRNHIKNPPKKTEKTSSKLYELPRDVRLEEFHDYLMEFITIDFVLQAYLEKKPDENLATIERNLFKAIEKLRDFVLK